MRLWAEDDLPSEKILMKGTGILSNPSQQPGDVQIQYSKYSGSQQTMVFMKKVGTLS